MFPTVKNAAFTLVLTAAFAGVPAVRADEAELESQVQTILKTHCYRCHGQDGSSEGGLGYIADLQTLVERRKVIPGNATRSRLYKRMSEGTMPPDDVTKPSAEEIGLVKQWIEAKGNVQAAAPVAPPPAPAPAPAPVAAAPAPVAAAPAPVTAPAATGSFIGEAQILQIIYNDLRRVKIKDRPFVRYFTLAHLHNAGHPEEELSVHRQALSKLVNSLSWEKAIAAPQPADEAQTVMRIDLRHYRWTPELWDRVVEENPYGVRHSSQTARAIYGATKTELPYLRADWFVFTASRPPLYHELLQLPKTDKELEQLLGVDVNRNIEDKKVVRAGFNDSGVSQNPRMIERHASPYGAYWKSYDFGASTGNKNLFARPLGPGTGKNDFQHDGGEIIFNLPNGLQAYMLTDAKGNRIDKGPTAIVSDPRRPDRAVENGISCMSCHASGIIEKTDQIRAHVERNPGAFKREATDVRALYPAEADLKAKMRDDSRRFLDALQAAGAPVGTNEPVITVASRFEKELDLRNAAAELGLKPQTFQNGLTRVPALGRALGQLNVEGGTVKRQLFVDMYGIVVDRLKLGTHHQAASEARKLTGHAGSIVSVALSPDGRFALSTGTDDKDIHLWDVETGKRLGKFTGHTATVTTVTFSADGRQVLSGAKDKAVKLWDVKTKKELTKFAGHTGIIYGVSFTAEGKVVSASADGTLRLWEAGSGKEVKKITAGSQARCVSVSPDGKQAVTGLTDGTIRLWDLATGKEVRKFEGHTKAVRSVAFSADGFRVLSGSADATMRLWDAATAAELRLFEGNTGPLWCVTLSPDGRRALSAGDTFEMWNVATGKAVRRLDGHAGSVFYCVLSPDGRKVLSGGQDKLIRLWGLSR